MICENCGASWKRIALLCLAVDFGVKTNDPNYCNDSDDHEHNWAESPPIDGDSE